METQSCTIPGREKDGWMKYGEFDYLLYGFQQANQSLEVYIIPFQMLKRWFWQNYKLFPETITEQINKTACRIIPISEVKEAVGYKKIKIQ